MFSQLKTQDKLGKHKGFKQVLATVSQITQTTSNKSSCVVGKLKIGQAILGSGD